MFGNDLLESGAPAGYATEYFRDTLPVLDAVISDQAHFLEQLKTRYGLVSGDAAKLACLYQPTEQPRTDTSLTRTARLTRPPTYRRQILWAGRITRSKNPSLLFALARQNPSYDFHVYGTRDRLYRLPRLRNLFRHGAFQSFDEIPHEQYDMFLYTSLWDGLPNILLEAAARRLPIIAPTVGGIGELVTPETGWPVTNPRSRTEFADNIRRIAFGFTECDGLARLAAMHRLIEARHSMDSFKPSVAGLFREGDQGWQISLAS